MPRYFVKFACVRSFSWRANVIAAKPLPSLFVYFPFYPRRGRDPSCLVSTGVARGGHPPLAPLESDHETVMETYPAAGQGAPHKVPPNVDTNVTSHQRPE